MKLTWFDANSWLIESAGLRVLVDPWLVGDLVFADLSWLVRGKRPKPIDIPQNIDLILLSQGLADHAHPETLKTLDRSIPVVASVSGAKVAQSLHYESVTAVAHGEQLRWGEDARLIVEAFVGAPVGPTAKENAYVLSFVSEEVRLYYEPHGYPDSEHLKQVKPVDVAITPMADQVLMGIAPVVRGSAAAPQIAELLNPKVMLPTAAAGNVTYDGLIAPTLTTKGGVDQVRSLLCKQGTKTQLIQPTSGKTVELDLSQY
ncbi:MAG: MBL fold metallo-hydrolase [Cyanobacteria bacterium J06598_1]